MLQRALPEMTSKEFLTHLILLCPSPQTSSSSHNHPSCKISTPYYASWLSWKWHSLLSFPDPRSRGFRWWLPYLLQYLVTCEIISASILAGRPIRHLVEVQQHRHKRVNLLVDLKRRHEYFCFAFLKHLHKYADVKARVWLFTKQKWLFSTIFFHFFLEKTV